MERTKRGKRRPRTRRTGPSHPRGIAGTLDQLSNGTNRSHSKGACPASTTPSKSFRARGSLSKAACYLRYILQPPKERVAHTRSVFEGHKAGLHNYCTAKRMPHTNLPTASPANRPHRQTPNALGASTRDTPAASGRHIRSPAQTSPGSKPHLTTRCPKRPAAPATNTCDGFAVIVVVRRGRFDPLRVTSPADAATDDTGKPSPKADAPPIPTAATMMNRRGLAAAGLLLASPPRSRIISCGCCGMSVLGPGAGAAVGGFQ